MPAMTLASRHSVPRDIDAAQEYRREAARLRALAHTSMFSEVRDDLTCIAQEYEHLAQQRDEIVHRYGG
jgi:hypothetical protein